MGNFYIYVKYKGYIFSKLWNQRAQMNLIEWKFLFGGKKGSKLILKTDD